MLLLASEPAATGTPVAVTAAATASMFGLRCGQAACASKVGRIVRVGVRLLARPLIAQLTLAQSTAIAPAFAEYRAPLSMRGLYCLHTMALPCIQARAAASA